MNQFVSDYEACELICEYGRRLYHRGLVGGVDGNISCRVSENEIWITPTMTCKGFLTKDVLLKMRLDGTVVSQSIYRPSSETPMHLRVYQENPQHSAIIHAHPKNATILAAVGEDIPADLLAEGVYFFGDTLHVAPFAQPGTDELGNCVLPYCSTGSAALLANHGALAWGESLQEAFIAMESVENYCEVYLYTHYIVRKFRTIPADKKKLLSSKYSQ